ncbi:unnamed protein product [Brassica rapa subsp. narinosa]
MLQSSLRFGDTIPNLPRETSRQPLSNGMMPSSKSKKPLIRTFILSNQPFSQYLQFLPEIGTDSVSLSESSGKDMVVAKEGEFYEARRGSSSAVEEKRKIFFCWVFLECLFTVTVEAVKAK